MTGAWLLKQKLGSNIALSAAAGASGADRQERQCSGGLVPTDRPARPIAGNEWQRLHVLAGD